MIPRDTFRQHDHSAGELVEHAKRGDDNELVRAGARQLRNWRLLNTGRFENRPGRTLLFTEEGRTDEVRMNSTTTYRLIFGPGTIKIRTSAGALVASQGGYPWTVSDVDRITWVLVNRDVLICFPGMRPVIARWDGGSGWTFSQFSFLIDGQGRRREPYFRFATPGVTLAPGGLTGTTTMTASAPVFQAGHIGYRFRYVGRQFEIVSLSSSTLATVNIIEALPQTWLLTKSANDSTAGFRAGDPVVGVTTGARGICVAVDPGSPSQTITVVMTKYGQFQLSEFVTGPNGRIQVGNQQATTLAAINVWDEAVCSPVRGWPGSCFFDQNRAGFCDFAGLPEGIAWSATGIYDDFDPRAENATDAIFETVPGKPRVYHVMGGADEFVFSDKGVYYIPISEANPLKPGSVAFRKITSDACSSVRPIETAEAPVFVNAGRNRVVAIIATGQTAKPYITRDVSEYHSHLFKSIKALAVTNGDGASAERYVWSLNSDGSIAVGKFVPGKEWVGWVPWSGAGAIEWISALDANLTFTTRYIFGANNIALVETLTEGAYLDGQFPLNAVPAPLTPPPGGMGPLWFYANATLDLMDGHRYLGQRAVDVNGNLVLEPGDDFSAGAVRAGLKWTAIYEPFIPHGQSGQSRGQTMRRRKVKRAAVAFQNSSGFVIGNRRVAAYKGGENQDIAPPLREGVERFRVPGRSFDPRVGPLLKDTPGPLRIIEFSADVTV